MQKLELHKSLGLSDEELAFDYLMKTISPTVRDWDYFVNWKKATKNTEQYGTELELFQTIVGKDNFLENLRELIRYRPEVIRAIPALLVRDGSNSSEFTMLRDPIQGKLATMNLNFNETSDLSEFDIQDILEFVEKTGLAKIFGPAGVVNVYDYLLGVEAGVDSNGRKNRGGKAMEFLVEAHVKSLVAKNPGWKYFEQASDRLIAENFGEEFKVNLSGRRFDFAVFTGESLILMEVNFYSSGGSKLKATAGEFVGLHQQIKKTHAKLVWVTDGKGWNTAKMPLRRAFGKIDHVFNLNLIELGALEEVCNQ